MGFISSLKHLVMELEKPEPLGKLPELVSKAIDEYAVDSPKLYSTHKDFFDVIKGSSGELIEAFKALWSKYPRGGSKSIYVCFRNRLSHWTDVCVRIRTGRRAGGEPVVESIAVDRWYRPQKYATHMIFLSKPSKEELVEGIRKLKA